MAEGGPQGWGANRLGGSRCQRGISTLLNLVLHVGGRKDVVSGAAEVCIGTDFSVLDYIKSVSLPTGSPIFEVFDFL